MHNLPVLFHCGISSYYLSPENKTREDAALGKIHYARELISNFPGVTFIAGHAGLYKYKDVINMLSPFPNVMVDTSIHSPAHVRSLIGAFGQERVMFGSGWPFGGRIPAVKIVKKACKGDTYLERLVLYENAASILKSGSSG